MATTFEGALAQRRGRAFVYATIAGIGRRIGATAAASRAPYCWGTDHPIDHGYTAAASDIYVAGLERPPASISARVDPKSGETSIGGLTLDLVDRKLRTKTSDHGWGDYVWTDLLAFDGPAHSTHSTSEGVWQLASDLNATSTSIVLVSAADIASGDVLHLGDEAVVVDSIAGAPTITVHARGDLGTIAAAHKTRDNGGEGFLYDRPVHLKGREVRLYLRLFDSATGLMLPDTEDQQIWVGIVQDYVWTEDMLGLQISCAPGLKRLRKRAGRYQIHGTARLDEAMAANIEAAMAAGENIPIDVELPVGENVPGVPPYDSSGGDRAFYARLGDQLVQMYFTEYGSTGKGDWVVTDWGLLGTTPKVDPAGMPIWDVLLTHPAPGDAVPLAFYSNAAGEQLTHPAEILLQHVTSRLGDETNGGWDTLPADPDGVPNVAAGIAVGDIATQTWQDVIRRYEGLSFTRFVLGKDGKPWDIYRWARSEILGPLGWFLYPQADGELALREIREAYPLEELATLDESDIDVETVRIAGNLSQTLARQEVSYDFDLAEDKPRRVIVVQSAEARERAQDDADAIEWTMHGPPGDPATADALKAAMVGRARLFTSPLPILYFECDISKAMLDVATPVSLTISGVPNPLTGTRGLVAQKAVIVERELRLSPDPGGTCVAFRAILLPEPNVCHWAPSGTVSAYAAGPPIRWTLNANDHTETSGYSTVPARDALGFAVGDKLMLVDSKGAVLNDNVMTVTAIELGGANTIDTDVAPTLAAAPVAPNAGDVLTFCHYANAVATPQGAWTASMKDYAVQSTGGVLGNTTDVPNVYGG